MAIEINNFLISLMVLISSRSGLAFVTAGPTAARSLWPHEIGITPTAADPATVIRFYGGGSPSGFQRKIMVNAQQMTRGTTAAGVLEQAWKVQEAFLSDSGKPMMHQVVAGKKLSSLGAVEADTTQDWEIKQSLPLTTPGIIGRDEDGKWMASANYEIEFMSVAK